MTDYKYIGKSIPRKDSLSRVTGETKYVSDIKRHNMLYGKLILSEKPHADVEFDFSEALQVEGVYKIYTHKDVPKVQYNSMEWYSGVEGIRDEYIINDRARFVGDRIALVLGYSKVAVEKAIKKVKIIYNELPVVPNISIAEKDEIIIKGSTNLVAEKIFSSGDVDKAFEEADLIVKDVGHTPKTHHLAIENFSALSEIDEFGNLVVSSGNQVVFGIQRHLSRLLNIPYSMIRVKKANLGGSFGAKQQPLLELVAACVAWQEKKPVMIYMDRKQSMIGVVSRTEMDFEIETAVKFDGTILGRKINAKVDGGAYATNNTIIMAASAKKIFRLYKMKHQRYTGKAYFTNVIPSGACRAYGGPQIHAVTEVNLTNVAKKLGMDPCELRMKNLINAYDEDLSGGPNLGKAGIKECLSRGMEKFNWIEKYNHIHEKDDDRYLHGVGMACVTHGSGYLGVYPDFINLELIIYPNSDVLCKVAVHEQGCGTIATLEQVVAEVLDIDTSKVRVTEADTFITPYDAAGTQASRVSVVASGAIKESGEQMIEKLFETINKVEGVEYSQMYIENGFVKIKNSDKAYSYGDISTIREKVFSDKTEVFVHRVPKANPATLAACFAEVKIDKYTGLVEVVNFLAAHDIGRAINPMLVEGQIHGGAQFSLGMALSEELVIDDKGYIKNQSLSKYHVLNSQDMPYIDSIIVETEDDTSPFGLKSIGEVTAVGPAPAVMNAINHALGTNITRFPATPEVIIGELNKKIK